MGDARLETGSIVNGGCRAHTLRQRRAPVGRAVGGSPSRPSSQRAPCSSLRQRRRRRTPRRAGVWARRGCHRRTGRVNCSSMLACVGSVRPERSRLRRKEPQCRTGPATSTCPAARFRCPLAGDRTMPCSSGSRALVRFRSRCGSTAWRLRSSDCPTTDRRTGSAATVSSS